jgi:hypothetical protein
MMRHVLTAAVLGAVIFSGCKKDGNGCSGGNLCFKLNGTEVSVTAVRKSLPNNRNRLYWETGSGNTYRNVEIDIYGNTQGTYTIKEDAGTDGDASFQYFINENGTSVNHVGISGTINLTSASGGWSGSFSGSVTDGTQNLPLTDGKFMDVQPE